MNTKESVKAVSKHCYTKYASIPSDTQRQAISVINLVFVTPITTFGAPKSEDDKRTKSQSEAQGGEIKYCVSAPIATSTTALLKAHI